MSNPLIPETKHAMHNASSSNIWLECDLYYIFKARAEKNGEVYNRPTVATTRGSALHSIAEHALGILIQDGVFPHATERDIEATVDGQAEALEWYNLEDLEQVAQALTALQLYVVANCDDGPAIELEIDVPLPHEPHSTGAIDVCIVDEHRVHILDYKFGNQFVSPSASQLKIYSASVIEFLERKHGIEFDTIIQGVIQPANTELIISTATFAPRDIIKFQGHVDEVVQGQVEGRSKRGIDSPSKCGFCPFKANEDGSPRCSHRANLIADSMRDTTLDETFPEERIEEIVEHKAEITAFIKECTAAMVANPETYPNWKQTKVKNKAGWDKAFPQDVIVGKLMDAGVNPFELSTPAKLLKKAPEHSELIETYIGERTSHVRLKKVNNKEEEE